MSNKTIETKLLPVQVEPAQLKDEELDQVSGGMMSTTRSGYKTNQQTMDCCF